MKRRCLMILLLLMLLPMRGLAEGSNGYIRLKMAYNGKPISGGSVTLYDVSDSPEGVDPLEMLVYVKELGIPGIEIQVDGSGVVAFEDLPAGRYFLVQQKAPGGFYPIRPFLVELSPAAGGLLVDGIEARPKLQQEQQLPQSGQLKWPAWVMLGLGTTVTAVGFHSWKRG